MKKLSTALLCCGVILAVLLVVTLTVPKKPQPARLAASSTFVYSSANNLSSQGTPHSAAPSAAPAAGRQAIFLVKAYEGKIGIYHVGEAKPFRILNVQVSSLPAADQQLLRSGISLQSSDQLQAVLEDYGS